MSKNADRYKELLEHVVCNQCGADNFDVVYPARYEDAQPDELIEAFRASGDEILVDQLVKCKSCGLKYLTPRLRQDLILEGYSEGSDETFVSQVAARERTFAKCLDEIERAVERPGRILDIGTASGAFLGVAKQRGWDVVGCEPNKWMAEWGSNHYGINVQAGTLSDLDLEDASFDVVTLWDVLEHTSDPKSVLADCRRLLKPGGLLVVNYPDMDSFIGKLMGRKWVFLLSVHLYYFNRESMKNMLEAVGYSMAKPRQHWQSLELGYILFRMKPYLSLVATLGTKIVNLLRLQHLQIPYWMGQVRVFARRVD